MYRYKLELKTLGMIAVMGISLALLIAALIMMLDYTIRIQNTNLACKDVVNTRTYSDLVKCHTAESNYNTEWVCNSPIEGAKCWTELN